MDESQASQVRIAAQLNTPIHHAERDLKRLHDQLETLLESFTGEQGTLYAALAEAQEKHWKSLEESSPGGLRSSRCLLAVYGDSCSVTGT